MVKAITKELKLHPPDEFNLECTTVWAFPRRGNWATHKSDWRGNWAPEVVRNLILRYSQESDILLDPMIGGGTTAIEAKILNRNIICSDVNDVALKRTRESLNFDADNKSWQKVVKRDARNLSKAESESIDFILTHPPYTDIIKYSKGEIDADLSNIHDLDEFADEMEKVAKELYRVLKTGKFCAILMGDTRRKKMYQPLAYKVMARFLNAGFNLKEDIIKRQYNCKATGFWVNKSKESNFLLIMHEHLFVFQKPENKALSLNLDASKPKAKNKKIILISCVSKKQESRAKAKDLYISQLFKFNLQYAYQLKPDNIYILSAEYGLLDIEEKIKPYNKTLNTMPVVQRKAWAEKVLKQMEAKNIDIKNDEFIFLAGEKYRQFLKPYMNQVKIPLEGLPIGKQLQELKRRISNES